MSKPINMRRCVVCRQVRHKSELIRIVKTSSGEISFDESGKTFGRGTYVCKETTCAETLKKRRNLDKIFKTKLPNELYDKICAAVDIKEKIRM
jgi:hypothetical protein